MTTYIYYNGIGARKNGKHTVKNFMNRMRKHNRTAYVSCGRRKHNQTYKPCLNAQAHLKASTMKNMAKPNRHMKLYERNMKTCRNHYKPSNNNCNLNNYIEFVGARKGQ